MKRFGTNFLLLMCLCSHTLWADMTCKPDCRNYIGMEQFLTRAQAQAFQKQHAGARIESWHDLDKGQVWMVMWNGVSCEASLPDGCKED